MFIIKMTEILSAMEAEMIAPKEPGVILVPGDNVPLSILQKLTANGTAAEFVHATDEETPFLCGYFMALRSGLRVISLDESISLPRALTHTETDNEPAFWPGQEEEIPESTYYDTEAYYPDPLEEQCIEESYYEEPAVVSEKEDAPDEWCPEMTAQDDIDVQEIPDAEIPELPPLMTEDDVINTSLTAPDPATEKEALAFGNRIFSRKFEGLYEMSDEEAKKNDYSYLIKDDTPEADPDDLQVYAQYKAEQETQQELQQIEDEKTASQIADVKAFLVDCGLQEELRCVDEDEVVKQVIKAAKETKSRTAFQKKLTALLAPTAYKHISAKIYDKIFDKLEDLRAMVADNEAN